MKSVLIPTFAFMAATVVLAGLFVWTGFAAKGDRAHSADRHDGYYITEIQGSGR